MSLEYDAEAAAISPHSSRIGGPNLVDVLFAGQSGGFTPAFSGTGSGGTDTVDFVLGTQAVKATTNGAGGQSKISGTFGTALNLTGKCLVLWIKMENLGTFLGGYPRIYLGDTALTNVYWWHLASPAAQPYNMDGEWMRVTLPFSAATVVGSPVRSTLAAVTIQVFDNSAGTCTFHLGGMATMNQPAQWPQGVLSIAFDDGFDSQFTTAKPYMDKYGYRGTSYLIAEALWNNAAWPAYMTLSQAQQLEQYSGWEIGAHAYSFANHDAGYIATGDAQSQADMQNAFEYLSAQGFKAAGHFAYPLGAFDATTVTNANTLFASGRTISQLGGFPQETFPPAQSPRLRSIAVNTLTSVGTIEGYITAAQANLDWLILVFHNIVTTPTGGSVTQFSTANFQSLMDFVSTANIPVRPVGEVMKVVVT